jgi:GNAT superfamily N-acetyltransferase
MDISERTTEVDRSVVIEAVRMEHMKEVILLLQNISTYMPPREYYDDIWNSFLNQPNVFAVSAIENGKVVGYGSIFIESKIRGGKVGHIEDIVSEPSRRNGGIGKMLVNGLCDIARLHQCFKVVLFCRQHNVAFYEKCDFKTSGVALQRIIGD